LGAAVSGGPFSPRAFGHGCSRRVLEIWRDDEQPRPQPRNGSFQCVEIDAACRHRDAGDLALSALEDILEAGIDGVFDEHSVAGRDQQSLKQVECLLAAAGDDQIVFAAHQGLRTGVIEQKSSERCVAEWRSEFEYLPCMMLQGFFTGRAEVGRREKLGGRT